MFLLLQLVQYLAPLQEILSTNISLNISSLTFFHAEWWIHPLSILPIFILLDEETLGNVDVLEGRGYLDVKDMRIAFDLHLKRKIGHGAERSNCDIDVENISVLIYLRGAAILKDKCIFDGYGIWRQLFWLL